MDDKALCEFVVKWVDVVNEKHLMCSYCTKRIFVSGFGQAILIMLDDLIETFDSNSPQWVEASAVGQDGVTYWARENRKDYNSKFDAFCAAEDRVDHLAKRGARMTDAERLKQIAGTLPDWWEWSRDDLLRIAQRLEDLDREDVRDDRDGLLGGK